MIKRGRVSVRANTEVSQTEEFSNKLRPGSFNRHHARLTGKLRASLWLILPIGAFLTCRRVIADGRVKSLQNVAGSGSGHYLKRAGSVPNCWDRCSVCQIERKSPSVTRDSVTVEHVERNIVHGIVNYCEMYIGIEAVNIRTLDCTVGTI